MSTIIVDDLDNASGGYGQTVDVAAALGNGVAVIPVTTVVADSKVTAGAVILQSGVAGAGGITWSDVSTATSVVAGAGTTVTAPGSAIAYARVRVSTPVAGGKVLVTISA
jgi:hypothetical protein